VRPFFRSLCPVSTSLLNPPSGPPSGPPSLPHCCPPYRHPRSALPPVPRGPFRFETGGSSSGSHPRRRCATGSKKRVPCLEGKFDVNIREEPPPRQTTGKVQEELARGKGGQGGGRKGGKGGGRMPAPPSRGLRVMPNPLDQTPFLTPYSKISTDTVPFCRVREPCEGTIRPFCVLAAI